MTADRELWLSQDIINRLNEPLNPDRIVTFTKGPQQGLKYLEGHDVVANANRIFGYGNWGYRLVGQPWVIEEGAQGQNATPYQVWAAAVEVTIAGCTPFEELGTNTRQGTGSASLEMAIKGAVTDGMKRCLKNYGDQFGLVLYDKDNEYWDAPQDVRHTNTSPPPQTRQEPQRSAPQGQAGGRIDWDTFWRWARDMGEDSQSLGRLLGRADMKGATQADIDQVIEIVTVERAL